MRSTCPGPARAGSTRRRSRMSRRSSPTGCGRRWDAMATDQALHGLDQLELGPAQTRRDPARIARRAWAAAWPKLLAIALVLGIWELITLTGWKHYVFKGPWPVATNLWHDAIHGNLWSVIGATLQTAVIG